VWVGRKGRTCRPSAPTVGTLTKKEERDKFIRDDSRVKETSFAICDRRREKIVPQDWRLEVEDHSKRDCTPTLPTGEGESLAEILGKNVVSWLTAPLGEKERTGRRETHSFHLRRKEGTPSPPTIRERPCVDVTRVLEGRFPFPPPSWWKEDTFFIDHEASQGERTQKGKI